GAQEQAVLQAEKKDRPAKWPMGEINQLVVDCNICITGQPAQYPVNKYISGFSDDDVDGYQRKLFKKQVFIEKLKLIDQFFQEHGGPDL
ncbi:MAG: hypothetical protein OEL55_04370, partial [Desulfobulbaceae bacterium]|nr:hypothetical protein [Desulfobulbaceae bacterium]